jgi:transcriptional regulator with XRE-family HTH domain
MDIQQIKNIMKSQGITYEELSSMSNIPLNTLKNIFRGKTQNPRIDTMKAIEKALGLDNEALTDISAEERDFIEVFRQLTEDEKKEFTNIANFILSKRK